jgi:hypothetical protein
MIKFSGLPSPSDESAQESDADPEKEKEHGTADSPFANIGMVIPSDAFPTPTSASTMENTDTGFDCANSKIEKYHGADGALFDEMTKPFISSKDYAQAQLVDFCNKSKAPKGFHNDLVKTLKRLRKQHNLDPTKTLTQANFFKSCLSNFLGPNDDNVCCPVYYQISSCL